MNKLRPFALTSLLLASLASQQVLADATVTFHGTLVNAPNCTINGNNVVDVDFGDQVITRQVDGVNYKQPIDYELLCTSIASNGMRVSIGGTGAPFDATLINTNKTGLGIQLYNGASKIDNGTQLNFTYPTTPKLYAAPATNDALALTAGPFTGTASLVLSYQ
jgi:type 1 fimbria pilin